VVQRLFENVVLLSWFTRAGPGSCSNGCDFVQCACFGMLLKFDCLMPVLAAFIVSKNETFAKRMAPESPGLLQWYVA